LPISRVLGTIKYMNKFKFQAVIWKEGRHFVAQCLNVDVSSFSSSKLQAMKNLNEALELYFEDEKPKKFVKIEKAEVVPTTVKYA